MRKDHSKTETAQRTGAGPGRRAGAAGALARRLVVVGLCAGLAAGCTLPRGAGFQAEVLGLGTSARADQPADLQVETVTRDALRDYADWPDPTAQDHEWLPHRNQPASQLIASGDEVSVTVWDTEDNSLMTGEGQKFVTLENERVSAAGRVFLPYIGSVRIAGMAPGHAREVIEKRYLDVVPSAQVQIGHRPGRHSAVSMVGGIGKPGNYTLEGRDITLLSMISQAGGIEPSLTNPQVRLMRGGRVYGIAAARLMADPRFDTVLRGGDKVVIEEDRRYFLSLGAAAQEAMHPFPRDDLSALDAMSVIGGVSDSRADPKGILILREYPETALRDDGTGPRRGRVVFVLDLTSADGLFSARKFPIRSGDLIYATESAVTSTQTVFNLISSLFVVTNQASDL